MPKTTATAATINFHFRLHPASRMQPNAQLMAVGIGSDLRLAAQEGWREGSPNRCSHPRSHRIDYIRLSGPALPIQHPDTSSNYGTKAKSGSIICWHLAWVGSNQLCRPIFPGYTLG